MKFAGCQARQIIFIIIFKGYLKLTRITWIIIVMEEYINFFIFWFRVCSWLCWLFIIIFSPNFRRFKTKYFYRYKKLNMLILLKYKTLKLHRITAWFSNIKFWFFLNVEATSFIYTTFKITFLIRFWVDDGLCLIVGSSSLYLIPKINCLSFGLHQMTLKKSLAIYYVMQASLDWSTSCSIA